MMGQIWLMQRVSASGDPGGKGRREGRREGGRGGEGGSEGKGEGGREGGNVHSKEFQVALTTRKLHHSYTHMTLIESEALRLITTSMHTLVGVV